MNRTVNYLFLFWDHNRNHTESFRGGNKPEPFETNHFMPVQLLHTTKGWEVKI